MAMKLPKKPLGRKAMKAWRVDMVDDPDVGVWVHAETSGKAKSAALRFDWFSDHDWGTYLYLRAKRVPELDDKPLTMVNLKAIGSYLVDYDEEWEPSTEEDWPIECRCGLCAPEEKARRERCERRYKEGNVKRICINPDCGWQGTEDETYDFKHPIGARLCPMCRDNTEKL